MLDPVLFLGIARDDVLDFMLQNANPHLVNVFTSGGDYLSSIRKDNQSLLGKYLPSLATLEELSSLEANVLSLIKRLAPDYPVCSDNLSLYTFGSDKR